jgi:hypothetical protein
MSQPRCWTPSQCSVTTFADEEFDRADQSMGDELLVVQPAAVDTAILEIAHVLCQVSRPRGGGRHLCLFNSLVLTTCVLSFSCRW